MILAIDVGQIGVSKAKLIHPEDVPLTVTWGPPHNKTLKLCGLIVGNGSHFRDLAWLPYGTLVHDSLHFGPKIKVCEHSNWKKAMGDMEITMLLYEIIDGVGPHVLVYGELDFDIKTVIGFEGKYEAPWLSPTPLNSSHSSTSSEVSATVNGDEAHNEDGTSNGSVAKYIYSDDTSNDSVSAASKDVGVDEGQQSTGDNDTSSSSVSTTAKENNVGDENEFNGSGAKAAKHNAAVGNREGVSPLHSQNVKNQNQIQKHI
jgi:hypothetical protein